MTFISLTIALLAMSPAQTPCSLNQGTPSEQRSFTNADLERMSACRYQTGVQSEADESPSHEARTVPRPRRSSKKASASPGVRSTSVPLTSDSAEALWRAQWKWIDQKTKRLREEAFELRQEAGAVPSDPKKKAPTGRRSPSLLITRAESLESQARDLENEFQERARREGALPGWLRPEVR